MRSFGSGQLPFLGLTGFVGTGGIISGSELNQMDDANLRERIRHSNIFARMEPQQKLKLANAPKAKDEVTKQHTLSPLPLSLSATSG